MTHAVSTNRPRDSGISRLWLRAFLEIPSEEILQGELRGSVTAIRSCTDQTTWDELNTFSRCSFMVRIMPYLLQFSNLILRASSGFNSPDRHADVCLNSILAYHVVTNGEWFASVA